MAILKRGRGFSLRMFVFPAVHENRHVFSLVHKHMLSICEVTLLRKQVIVDYMETIFKHYPSVFISLLELTYENAQGE